MRLWTALIALAITMPACDALSSAEGTWEITCEGYGTDRVPDGLAIAVKDSGGKISGSILDPEFHPTDPHYRIAGDCSGTRCAFTLLWFQFHPTDPFVSCPQHELGTPVTCFQGGWGGDATCQVVLTP